jgi:gluconolactonase
LDSKTGRLLVILAPRVSWLLTNNCEYTLLADALADTKTTNTSINAILAAARNATWYAYDEEFLQILGPSPKIRLVDPQSASSAYAHEAGAWDYDRNEVWFTSDSASPPGFFSILNLDNYTVRTPKSPLQDGRVPTGGTYYDGKLYFTVLGNISISEPPAVYSIDPVTLSAETVLNSYFGVHLNSIDDITWVIPNICNTSNMFFTSLDLAPAGGVSLSNAVLPNAVYRFTPSTKSLQAVISRGDVLAPNGINVDASGKYLYVTDSALTALTGPGADRGGSTAVFRFELDVDCNPTNKQLFAMPRSGFADGMHIDNVGRVWTAEFNGIVVRNPQGKELGVFNAESLLKPFSYKNPISNFALAGDKLVILAIDRIYVAQLAQNVTTPARS